MATTRGVVFDFDGTLFSRDQSTDYLSDAVRRWNTAQQRSDTTHQFAARIYKDADISRDLRRRISLDSEAPREIYRRMQAVADDLLAPQGLGIDLYAREIDPTRWYPDPDLVSVLETLRANNIKIGLLSNCGWDVTTVLRLHDLTEYFDALVLSYKVEHRKPEPEVFQIACERLGVKPEHALMVGDKPAREQPATRIGMHHLNVDLLHGGNVGLTAVLPFAGALGAEPPSLY